MKDYSTTESLVNLLAEMYLPGKKLGRDPVDLITHRKMQRQESLENTFVLLFFRIIERYAPKNEYSVEKFIDRFHTYISHNEGRTDISIAEIMYFIRMLDVKLLKKKSKMKPKAKMTDLQSLKRVANVTGIRSLKRLTELKTALEVDLLARIKRVMRGTSRDETHAGVAHPIQVTERFNAMRIRNLKAKWHMRKVQRQITQMDA